MNAFTRVLNPAVGTYGRVFVKVEWDGKRLSITGVEGPLSNGDAKGSCGQIICGYTDYDARGHAALNSLKPCEGWTHETIRQLFDAWDRWHLNHMRAGCEHQRAFDTTRQVEVVSYKLTHEAMQLRDSTRRAAADAALAGEPFNPTAQARALAELTDWFKSRYAPPDADSPLSGCYEVDKREMKAIGSTYPSEHPDGVLTKPCEVCGYKYGSAWLHEDVPADVLAMLQALPETTVTPAWV
jgi:hypothetical protein